MKKLILTGICIVALATNAGAQEQPTTRQQADMLFERYEYFKSLGLYLKVVKKQKNNVQLMERIADCYRNINHYEDAESWYARVVADAKASKISHYYYAEVLLRDRKFEQAKQQYQLFYTDDPQMLRRKLSNCDSAVSWMKKTSVYKIENDTGLNTTYSDWGLNYEGKADMVFTSDRVADYPDIDNRTGNNWFKLYEMQAGSNEVKQLPIATDDYSLFNDSYQVGPIAFNTAADTAYITVTTELPAKSLTIENMKSGQRLYTRRLQLVVADKRNDQWVVSGSFPYNNVQRYSVGEAALSKNGRIIYFSSDMAGGEGKTDIWYCEKQRDGTWGRPVNCGKAVNTKEEEAFPTIGGDGALYYSSKGLPGMGGYDIYKAAGQKSSWSIPKNLECPFNSTSDDLYLITHDGASGYFSSNRQGGRGSDDIYSFTNKKADSTPPKLIVHNQPPVNLTARPATPVPRNQTTVRSPAPVNPPAPIILATIYYDLDKSNIRPDAALELDKLTILLKQRPGLKIEVSSFTDSRASSSYNLALSQRRAASVVTYLVSKGISANRLVARFYGKTQLVNNCGDDVHCAEAAHQLNRRTEFRVISGMYP